MYFTLTHEIAEDDLFKNRPREDRLHTMANQFHSSIEREVFPPKMAGLGKEYPLQSKEDPLQSKEEQIQYIKEHIIEDFMREVYDPAF